MLRVQPPQRETAFKLWAVPCLRSVVTLHAILHHLRYVSGAVRCSELSDSHDVLLVTAGVEQVPALLTSSSSSFFCSPFLCPFPSQLWKHFIVWGWTRLPNASCVNADDKDANKRNHTQKPSTNYHANSSMPKVWPKVVTTSETIQRRPLQSIHLQCDAGCDTRCGVTSVSLLKYIYI